MILVEPGTFLKGNVFRGAREVAGWDEEREGRVQSRCVVREDYILKKDLYSNKFVLIATYSIFYLAFFN